MFHFWHHLYFCPLSKMHNMLMLIKPEFVYVCVCVLILIALS